MLEERYHHAWRKARPMLLTQGTLAAFGLQGRLPFGKQANGPRTFPADPLQHGIIVILAIKLPSVSLYGYRAGSSKRENGRCRMNGRFIMGVAVLASFSLAIMAEAGPKNQKVSAEKHIQHADKNQDGSVSKREGVAEHKYTQEQKAAVGDDARKAKADTDGDGKLTQEESRKAKTERYLKEHADVDKKWEDKADTNNNDKVSGEELKDHHHKEIEKKQSEVTNP